MGRLTVLVVIGGLLAGPAAFAKSAQSYQPQVTSSYPDETLLLSANQEMERALLGMADARLHPESGGTDYKKYLSAFNQLAKVRTQIMCRGSQAMDTCQALWDSRHLALLNEVDSLRQLNPEDFRNPALRALSFGVYKATHLKKLDAVSAALQEASLHSPKPVKLVSVSYDGETAHLDGVPETQTEVTRVAATPERIPGSTEAAL